jgi:DNA polymerase-3 subunit delta
MDALAFLSRSPSGEPGPIYVLAGDEDFLKREVRGVVENWVLGGEESFGLSAHAGDSAEFAAVRDDLRTLPFFGSRRLVVVENADQFVSEYRAQLEKYVAGPSKSGVLVLEVTTWPATTRLARQLADVTVTCKAPPAGKLAPWCSDWSKSRHGKQLTSGAAQLLVDLTGADMGLLDQELAKLAVYVGKAARIDIDDVDKLVGRSRLAEVWKIFDAIGAGRSAEALAILDQLMGGGEDPFRILGAFSMQVRRLAQVARLRQHGVGMGEAFDRARVPPWPAARQSCEQQLRHLGRRRSAQLFDWLLEVDLGMKGSSPLPPRMLLERLVARLGKKDEK